MLEKVVRMGILYHLYGPLLTKRQQSMVDLYYCQDLSLGEIALDYGISRQAVHDNIRRAEEILEECEEKLQFEGRLIALRAALLTLKEQVQPLLEGGGEGVGRIDSLFKELMDQLE